MDTERLAAYLDGELDADETAVVEAALAGDPRLRAQLDELRRADAALRSVPPTELPDGFEVRLRDTVDAELRTILRPDARGATVDDELAARRRRRSRGWVPALAGAAAAVAVVAGAVVGVGVLGGDDLDSATGDAETAMTLESFDADDAGEADAMALPAPGEGPTVVVGDRDLDDELADELLTSIELQAVTDRGLGGDEGRSLGTSWRAALAGLAPPVMLSDDGGDAPQTEADDGELAGDELRTADAPVRLLGDGLPSDEDLAAADRCLAEVLAADGDAIPAYLEVATFGGEEVVVVGLVTFDPASGAYTRPEVWVLAREDCQVRRFSQG